MRINDTTNNDVQTAGSMTQRSLSKGLEMAIASVDEQKRSQKMTYLTRTM